MAKVKTKWVCQNCGYETAKYIGRCPDCGEWGTLTEEVEAKQEKESTIHTIKRYKTLKIYSIIITIGFILLAILH